MLDNHWYLCIATLPDVFNRLKDAVPLLITHSLNNKLYCNRVLSKFIISFTHVDTCSITSTVLFAPCSCFCSLKYVPSEHKQYQSIHHDISPHIYIQALLPLLLVVLALAFVHVAQGWIFCYLSAIPYCCRACLTTAEARSNSLSYVCYIITASIQFEVFHIDKIDSNSDANECIVINSHFIKWIYNLLKWTYNIRSWDFIV